MNQNKRLLVKTFSQCRPHPGGKTAGIRRIVINTVGMGHCLQSKAYSAVLKGILQSAVPLVEGYWGKSCLSVLGKWEVQALQTINKQILSNPSSLKAEANGSPWIWGQPSLHSRVPSQNSTTKTSVTKQTNKQTTKPVKHLTHKKTPGSSTLFKTMLISCSTNRA